MTSRIKSKLHPHAALPDEGSASLISDARLIEIYVAMLKCRILRQHLRAHSSGAKLRAAAFGSEAVAAAVTIDLLPEERVISATRHLFAALVKSASPATLLDSLVARDSEAAKAANEALLARGVLAAPGAGDATACFASGIALAGKLANSGTVTVVFLEEAGTETAWREGFDFALSHDLPMVFVRQAAMPFPAGPGRNRGASIQSLPSGLPVIPVDRNDAVAIYRVAHEAIAHARRGSGPTLVDCVSVHLPGERKQDSDCLARMGHYLAAKGLHPERIQSKVAAKFTSALNIQLPPPAGPVTVPAAPVTVAERPVPNRKPRAGSPD